MRFLRAILLILGLFSLNALAGEVLVLDPGFRSQPLQNYLNVAYSEQGPSTAATTLSGIPYYFGGIIHARFLADNPSAIAQEFVLENRNAFLRHIEILVDGQLAGSWTFGQFDNRLVLGASSFLVFSLPPGRSQVEARIHPTMSSLQLILHTKAQAARIAQAQAWLGLLPYGGILALVLYSAFLFVRLRDRTFLYYILYATACLLINAIMTGWFLRALEYVGASPDVFHFFANRGSVIFAFLIGVGIFPFVSSYLNIWATHPALDRVMWAICWLSLLLALGTLLTYDLTIDVTRAWVLTTRIYGNVLALIPLGVAAYFHLQKKREGTHLLISLTPLVLGSLYWVGGMDREALQPIIRGYAGTFGMLLEMVLLAIGLGDRYRRLKISEKEKELIREILPDQVVKEKLKTGTVQPKLFPNSTVVFIDIEGFTEMSASLDPNALVNQLDQIFGQMDQIVEKFELVKIKTIGDAYMFAGMSDSPDGDALNACLATLEIIQKTERMSVNGRPIRVRAGAHTGPIVAGVVGKTKFHYDIWGDTVNVASRLESKSPSGRLKVSEATFKAVAGRLGIEQTTLEQLKGVGAMRTYLVKAGIEGEDLAAS